MLRIPRSPALFFLTQVTFVLLLLPERAPAATLMEDLRAATSSYYGGKIETAIQALERLADQELASGTLVDRQTALEYLLDSCVGGWDYGCLEKYAPAYVQVIAARTDIPAQLKRSVGLHAAYYFGVGAWLTGQKPAAEAWLKTVPESVGDESWDSRNYIRRQLLRARLYFVLEDRRNAQLCVDRALMSIASVKNSGSSLMELTDWLSNAIEMLDALGDTDRAIGLTQANSRFGQKVFPVTSIEFYWQLQRAADAFEAVGLMPQARDFAQRARGVLENLELAPNVARYLRANNAATLAMLCLLMADYKCASSALDGHPAATEVESIRQRGALNDYVDGTFFVIRAALDATRGIPEAPEDIVVLSNPVRPALPLNNTVTERLELYRRMAHALAIARSDIRGSQEELKSVAPDLIRIELEQSSLGILHRLDPVQHFMTELLMVSLGVGDVDKASGDTLVRLFDLDSRNGASFSVDALALMSAAADDDMREQVRSLLRLTSRRDSVERVDIGTVLAAQPQLDPTKAATLIENDFIKRSVYSDYGRDIRKALAELLQKQPGLTHAVFPPALASIQQLLRGDEVIVAAPVFAGVVGHLCIRQNQVHFTTSSGLDFPKLVRDARIVNAALTLHNPPSEQLDSQYPVDAARELYDTLLGPLDSCLKSGDSVLWVGPAPRDVPLAALLTTGTSETLKGVPMSSWPWFIKNHDISYVESFATFVAIRHHKIPSDEGQDREFLGIGDPVFSGSTSEGQDRGALSVRGVSGAGTLFALPRLPDTKIELQEVGALFPKRATILTETAATEADVRRLPIGRYSYISFATHGLVREDVTGLTEPALALTPESTSDTYNDGLLTASEISALPLSASFVALSACNTAELDYTKYASEVPALSAAFETAGVSSVLATLWPVESDASRRIVSGTFKGIADSVGPGRALADSQRDYLAHPPSVAHAHPRFWAPFVIFGDSINPTVDREKRSSPQIDAVQLLSHSGGDVDAMIRVDGQHLALRAVGDIRKGQRHASISVLFDNRLQQIWTNEDPDIGAAPLLGTFENDIIAGGYRGGGSDPVTASIQLLSKRGQVDEEWVIERKPDQVFPMALATDGRSRAYILLDQHSDTAPDKAPAPQDRLLIGELDRKGPPQIRFEAGLGTSDLRSSASLTPLGHDLLAATSEMFASMQPYSDLDEFHQIRGCLTQPITRLMLINSTKWTTVWQKDLPDVALSGSSWVKPDGSIVFVGAMRLSCDEGLRLGVWELNQNREIKNLYLDRGSRETSGTFVYRNSDGSLLVFGRSERINDVASLDERSVDLSKTLANLKMMRVNFNTHESSDVLVVKLDRNGKLISQSTIRGGADIVASGAISAEGKMWIYGELGGDAAVMRLRPQ